ncbi:MAG: energy transducer TonB [Alloprevotella sp.]
MKRLFFCLITLSAACTSAAFASCMDFAGERITIVDTTSDEGLPPQQKQKKFTVDTQPIYQGGEHQLLKDLSAAVRYPAECQTQKVEGMAIVKFTVTARGRISGVHIQKTAGNALLDAEAVRAVMALPGKWTPATTKGKKVDAVFVVPVRFALR